VTCRTAFPRSPDQCASLPGLRDRATATWDRVPQVDTGLGVTPMHRRLAVIGAAVCLLSLSSCKAPATDSAPFEPIPQDRFQRCAAEFAAKKEYCSKKYTAGSAEEVQCIDAALSGWNQCVAGQKKKFGILQ